MRLCLRNDDVALFRQAHGNAAERLARALTKLGYRETPAEWDGTSDIGRPTIGFAAFRLAGFCHYNFSHMLHLEQVVAGVFCCPLSAIHGAGPASTFT